MRSVKGYLADDGMFFDAKEDAELYEALRSLEFAVRNIGADPTKFMIVVEGAQAQLRRYLNAKEQYEANERRGPNSNGRDASASGHHADTSRATDNASVLEQPIDEPEHVSNIRSSVSAEDVRYQGEVNGLGSGSVDARGVRGDTDMAVGQEAGADEPRSSDRDKAVWRP